MSSKCMICYQAEATTVNTFDSESLLDNYPIIFLLKKLLPVSSEVCEDLLKENGHPSSWFSFCGSCLILVLKSQIIYSQLVHIQNDFESLQGEIKSKITQSFKSGKINGKENGTSPPNLHGSTEKIRNVIATSWGLPTDFHSENPTAIKVEVVDNSFEDDYDSNISDFDEPAVTNKRTRKCRVKKESDEDWEEDPSDPTENKNAKRVYRQTEKVQCPQCDQLVVKEYLELHIKKIHEGIVLPKPFSCSSATCGKTFKRLSDMQIHFRRKHSKETPYPCPYCSKKFTDLTKKRYHVKNVHIRGLAERKRKKIIDVTVDLDDGNNEQPPQAKKMILVDADPSDIPPEIEEKWRNNICHLCNKPYTQVQQHIRRVHAGVRPWKCGTCEKEFVSKCDMERHVRRKHTKETPYSCNDCEKKFTDTTKLFYHYKKIHPGLKNPYRKRPSPNKPLCKNTTANETDADTIMIDKVDEEAITKVDITQLSESLQIDVSVVNHNNETTVIDT